MVDGGRIAGVNFNGGSPFVTLVNGDGHTIRGSAEVTSENEILQIFNRGLIRAEGESGFVIRDPSSGQSELTEVDNRGGRIEIASDSFFSGRVVGGTIAGEAGSSFNGKARDVTFPSNLAFGAGAELGGTINNVGTLNLIARLDDEGREVGGFDFSDELRFEGGGELILQGGATPLITAIEDESTFLFLPRSQQY